MTIYFPMIMGIFCMGISKSFENQSDKIHIIYTGLFLILFSELSILIWGILLNIEIHSYFTPYSSKRDMYTEIE